MHFLGEFSKEKFEDNKQWHQLEKEQLAGFILTTHDGSSKKRQPLLSNSEIEDDLINGFFAESESKSQTWKAQRAVKKGSLSLNPSFISLAGK